MHQNHHRPCISMWNTCCAECKELLSRLQGCKGNQDVQKNIFLIIVLNSPYMCRCWNFILQSSVSNRCSRSSTVNGGGEGKYKTANFLNTFVLSQRLMDVFSKPLIQVRIWYINLCLLPLPTTHAKAFGDKWKLNGEGEGGEQNCWPSQHSYFHELKIGGCRVTGNLLFIWFIP